MNWKIVVTGLFFVGLLLSGCVQPEQNCSTLDDLQLSHSGFNQIIGLDLVTVYNPNWGNLDVSYSDSTGISKIVDGSYLTEKPRTIRAGERTMLAVEKISDNAELCLTITYIGVNQQTHNPYCAGEEDSLKKINCVRID